MEAPSTLDAYCNVSDACNPIEWCALRALLTPPTLIAHTVAHQLLPLQVPTVDAPVVSRAISAY